MDNEAQQNENWLLNKICQEYFTKDTTKEIYVPVPESTFNKLVPLLPDMGVTLIGLFAAESFESQPGITLFYVLEKRGRPAIVILQRAIPGRETTSIAAYFASAGWFEREIRDGFGIEFTNSFDTRRLFLHEAYPPGFHPLRKAFKNRDIKAVHKDLIPGAKYHFKEVEGEGVYQVLVGPVHAGIIEPGHFHFNVIGETIASLEVRMFYKHRGIEKLAEGKTTGQVVTIAESISGDESAANALAFCLAVERIAGTKAPKRAWQLRTILLEMERIYSHLGDLAGMIVDVAFPVGAAEFHILREEILHYNEILTGSRFMKGIICPGGLRRDIPYRNLLLLYDYLEPFLKRFRKAVDYIHKLDSVIDRLETTGVIRPQLVSPLNLTGPAARASGIALDTRKDHPYGYYRNLELIVRTAEKGDVLSRFDVKAQEIMDSVKMVHDIISGIGSGEILTKIDARDGYSLALVEAARGQSLQWVYLKNGAIDRYKILTASFCNWQAIEHAVIGNIIPDFPLINKSLNLSYAGTDL